MTWNWQQSDWANWRFDAHKDQLKVGLLSDEAMESSEIEGALLRRGGPV
jgi:hypothetical protein